MHPKHVSDCDIPSMSASAPSRSAKGQPGSVGQLVLEHPDLYISEVTGSSPAAAKRATLLRVLKACLRAGFVFLQRQCAADEIAHLDDRLRIDIGLAPLGAELPGATLIPEAHEPRRWSSWDQADREELRSKNCGASVVYLPPQNTVTRVPAYGHRLNDRRS